MNVESDDTEPVSGQDGGANPPTSTINWSERRVRWGLGGYSVHGVTTYSDSVQIFKTNPEHGGDQVSIDDENIQPRKTTTTEANDDFYYEDFALAA